MPTQTVLQEEKKIAATEAAQESGFLFCRRWMDVIDAPGDVNTTHSSVACGTFLRRSLYSC